jgi:hypothetical protein
MPTIPRDGELRTGSLELVLVAPALDLGRRLRTLVPRCSGHWLPSFTSSESSGFRVWGPRSMSGIPRAPVAYLQGWL